MSEVKANVTLDDIKAIVEQIVSRFHPEKVILFGSYAHGEPTADSDVDLLIVMETEENPLRTAGRIAATVDHPFAMDILVLRPAYLAESLAENALFETEVMAEGVVLYEAKNP